MQSEKCVDRFPYSCTLPLGLATWQPIGCTGPQAWMKRKFSQSLSSLQEEDTQKCRLQAQPHRNARSLGHHQSWRTTNYFWRQFADRILQGCANLWAWTTPLWILALTYWGEKPTKTAYDRARELAMICVCWRAVCHCRVGSARVTLSKTCHSWVNKAAQRTKNKHRGVVHLWLQ